MLPLEKDVDGFHPLNMGNLALRGREPLFIPCTPKGCIELLLRSGVEIMGKRAVVIGRSNIVGLPTSLLLQVSSNLHSNHLGSEGREEKRQRFFCFVFGVGYLYALFWPSS